MGDTKTRNISIETNPYEIDYNDERLTQVETEKNQALTENTNVYNDMRDQAKDFYQSQIDASKKWADKQQQLQQEQTDFTIDQIEQQKEQVNKDYIKEQSGAYVDWKKQSNQYGASAEQMAASGLNNTGYSESSKVSMYNTYQNRMAVAKESHSQAILNYDNKIQEARLQNNSALAEIAVNAYIQQTELALQGFQYDNSLLQAQMAQKEAIEDRYYNRYQDVLTQMNQENALAEEKRQYDEQMAYQKEQDFQEHARWQQEYSLAIQQLAEEKRQYDANLAEEQRQFDLLNQGDSSVKLNAGNSSSSLQDKAAALAANLKNAIETAKTNASSSKGTLGTAMDKLTKSYASSNTSSKYVDPVRCGNSPSTMNKDDYYFSNGYQPRYWNNEKLTKTNVTVQQVFGNSLSEYGIKGSQNVWHTSSNKICIWDDEEKTYIDVTDDYKEWAEEYFYGKNKTAGGGSRTF